MPYARPTALAFATSLAIMAHATASGAEPNRLQRTRAAMADLEQRCAAADAKGKVALTHRIPLVVGRLTLSQLDQAPAAERPAILDYVFEQCLRAKIALLEVLDGQRRAIAVPPAPSLPTARLTATRWTQGKRVVLPIAVRGSLPDAVRPFFAAGDLAPEVPALAGARPGTVETTEVFRIHQHEPAARRVGWDRPAGGFVRDATAGKPPVLICIDHPTVRQAIERATAKAMAPRTTAPRPLALSLGAGHFYADYSPLSAKRFVAWLKARYKSARIVNAVWDTQYTRFGPDMMPTPEQAAASPARWRDWVAFGQSRLTDHVRWARANVRRHAPNLPVGLSFVRYLLAGAAGLGGIDPTALANAVDVVEATGADALHADLAVALASGSRPVLDTSLSPGAFGVLPHLLHGAAAVGLPAWPPMPLTSLAAVRDVERALRESLDARRLAAPIAALAAAPKPIALLYSEASLRLAPAWALRSARTPHTHQLVTAYKAARFLDLGCRFVTSTDVAKHRLQHARIVVVPAVPSETEAVARALIDHVETGGHLVVLPESLTADEYGREADYLMRLGIEVLETKRPTCTTRPRPERGGALNDMVMVNAPLADIAPTPTGILARLPAPLKGRGARQKIRVNVRHEVLATFPDGAPAIVTFARGKGRVTYLAMPLERQPLAAVLRSLLAQAAVRPTVTLIATGDATHHAVECRSVRRGNRVLAYAWNTGPEAVWVGFGTPTATTATNLSTGEPLTVRGQGDRALVGLVRLAPSETVLVEIALGTRKQKETTR